jgi:low affinity Fe/Cu permease
VSATTSKAATGRSDRGTNAKPNGRDRSDGGERSDVALRDRFNQIADRLTNALGSFWALLASVLIVVAWALSGPVFHFSDTWQLFINTSTTVVTFWMVFVIQNSANRDAKAVHLKLDELIRAVEGARNAFITLENEPEEVVAEKAAELTAVAEGDEDHDVAVTVARRASSGKVRAATAIRSRRTTRNGKGSRASH